MVQAELFSKNIGHVVYASDIYDKFLESLGWAEKRSYSILDIGCGPGNILFEVLLPRLPENCTKIVGSDKSEDMVEYCKTMSKSPNMEFIRTDIEKDHLPDSWMNSFDHLFSTFCMQYILDFRITLQNCFNMLKPGGGLIFIFPTNNIVYDAYEGLSKIDKWLPYVKDYKNYKPVFGNKDDKYVKKFFEESGFIVKSCKIEEQTFSHEDMSGLAAVIHSMDSIGNKIPEADKERYTKDIEAAYRKSDILTVKNTNGLETPHLLFRIVTIVAQKPL